jgi:hypothetical protein
MHLAGIILTVIGGIILFAGSIGWRFDRASREEESGSPVDSLDLVVSGGVLATLSGILHLFAEVLKDRSSPLFSFGILMVIGLLMGTTGGIFLWLGAP